MKIKFLSALSLVLILMSPSILLADDLVTPRAYVLTRQVSLSAPDQPGKPFGVRAGMEDYFNQGGQFANIYEHGYVGVTDPNQHGSGTSYTPAMPARAYLPPCDSPTDSPCIESVSTRAVGETNWQLGTVSTEQPVYKYGEICADCASDFGPYVPVPFDKAGQFGGVPSMWTLPSAPHGGGTDYRVDVQLNHKLSTPYGPCGLAPCTFMQIVPLQLGKSKSFETISLPNSSVGRGIDFTQFEFPKNIEFRIILRLAGADLMQPDGFFFGRVENLSVVPTSDAVKRIIISGTPVRVPFAQVSGIPLATIPKNLIMAIDPRIPDIWTCKVVDVEACIMQFSSSSLNPLLYDFSAWERLGLRSIASGTIWELRAANPPSVGNCSSLMLNNGLTGTLSTNASLYSSDVPFWDEYSRSFLFNVASTHLDELGGKNRGYYQLSLRSDLIKCLWGSDASAANAEIQIVSEDGSSQIATTNVHVQDGTFQFTAANFEYSNPKLKVTFALPTPTPALTPLATPKAAPSSTLTSTAKVLKKSTITCVKGKTMKKVTEVKPICPSGYKKK